MSTTVIVNALLAVGCVGSAFFVGSYVTYHRVIDRIVDDLLDRLEKDGFLRMEIDEDGDRDIVPIAEIEKRAVQSLSKKWLNKRQHQQDSVK